MCQGPTRGGYLRPGRNEIGASCLATTLAFGGWGRRTVSAQGHAAGEILRALPLRQEHRHWRATLRNAPYSESWACTALTLFVVRARRHVLVEGLPKDELGCVTPAPYDQRARERERRGHVSWSLWLPWSPWSTRHVGCDALTSISSHRERSRESTSRRASKEPSPYLKFNLGAQSGSSAGNKAPFVWVTWTSSRAKNSVQAQSEVSEGVRGFKSTKKRGA